MAAKIVFFFCQSSHLVALSYTLDSELLRNDYSGLLSNRNRSIVGVCRNVAGNDTNICEGS